MKEQSPEKPPEAQPQEDLLEEFKRLYEAAYEKLKAAEQKRNTARIPERARLWMALSPAWTLPLARACKFPAGEGGLRATLERMLRVGLIESLKLPAAAAAETQVVYYMREVVSSEVLRQFLSESKKFKEVRQTLATVGKRLTATARTEVEVLPKVSAWATLAEHAASPRLVAQTFNRQVDRAFKKKDAVTILNLIDCARPLARLLSVDLDSSLELALQRAVRRLELIDRLRTDEGHLQYFLERREQVAALRHLIEGPDSYWGLHFMGAGGVGKTMLMRHLSVKLAERWKAAVARVDFDYLNADYPRRAPGLLLWSFAQELMAFSPTEEAAFNFRKCESIINKLHEHLSVESRGRWQGPATAHPLFIDALNLYVSACRELDRPVVLILDTCEELSRLRPDRQEYENVEETFRILSALHDGYITHPTGRTQLSSGGLPNLRVVFSGRRPLASAGRGWRIPTSDLPARPFLRLHETRGFTEAESRRFLLDLMEVPADLVQPIIDTSSDDAGPSEVVRTPRPRRADTAPRSKPYELRLYGDWAREKPPPSPKQITKASIGQYVETRIIQRLRDEHLRRLLPVLSLLGHFDKELFREVWDGESDFDVTLERLRQQEWIEVRLVPGDGPHGTRTVYDMERSLRRRLVEHYTQRGALRGESVERAAAHLERITLGRDLGALDWSTFDAAIRTIEQARNTAELVRWWQRIEDRIVSERRFEWAIQTIGFLRAKGGVAAAREVGETASESKLLPFVTATYAAMLANTRRSGEAAAAWYEAAQQAAAHPHRALASALLRRARIGRMIATSIYEHEMTAEIWREVKATPADALTPQMASAYVALAQGVIETLENPATNVKSDRALVPHIVLGAEADASRPNGVGHLAELINRAIGDWEREVPLRARAFEELRAFAYSLAARAALILEYPGDSAETLFLTSRSSLGSGDERSAAWADWVPPDDVPARVNLEYVRAFYPSALTAEDAACALNWSPLMLPLNADAERTTSLGLNLLRATSTLKSASAAAETLSALSFHGPASHAPPYSARAEEWVKYLLPQPATCQAHRVVPPLILAVANACVDSAMPDLALRLLNWGATQLGGSDLSVHRRVERAHAHIVRRLRLHEVNETVGESLQESSELEDHQVLWALRGLDGVVGSALPVIAESTDSVRERRPHLHALWRTTYARDIDQARESLNWMRRAGVAEASEPTSPADADDFGRWSLRFDLTEARHLAAATGLEGEGIPHVGESFAPRRWWESHRDRPAEALTLALRCEALRPTRLSKAGFTKLLEESAQRLGPQRAAEIALDEAELLTLRLPFDALPMLSRARQWFEAAQDHVGCLLSGSTTALVAARVGDQRALHNALDYTRSAYEQVLSRQASMLQSFAVLERAMRLMGDRTPNVTSASELDQLPGWETLANITPWNPPPPDFAPRWWRPWLVRLVCCLYRARHPRGMGTASTDPLLHRWLLDYLGSSKIEASLPADFQGLLVRSRSERKLPRVTEQEARNPDHVLRISYPVSALAPVGFRPPSLIETVQVEYARGYGTNLQSRGECFTKTPGLKPYAEAAADIPPDFISQTESLLHRAQTPNILLDIQQGLHGPCWEGMFAPGLRILPVYFLRTATSDTTVLRSGRKGLPENPTVDMLARGRVAREIFRRGWEVASGRFGINSTSNVNREMGQQTNIVHLIGTALQSSAGLRFSTVSEGFLGEMTLPSASILDEVGEGGSAAETNIGASQLCRIYSNASVVVLQGRVLEDKHTRTQTDRHDAMLARIFASELFANGIPLVIVIPALPPTLSTTVIRALAKEIDRGLDLPNVGQDILKLLLRTRRALQREVIKAPFLGKAQLTEVFTDICMYVQRNWSLREG